MLSDTKRHKNFLKNQQCSRTTSWLLPDKSTFRHTIKLLSFCWYLKYLQQLGFLKTSFRYIGWVTSEVPETSVLELLARRIQWCDNPSLFEHFHLFFKHEMPKNKNKAWVHAPVDAPWREFYPWSRVCCSHLGLAAIFLCNRFWWPI